MTNDVITPCPQCGEDIPFYQTVDDLKECPECGTYWETLFQIAQTPTPDETEAAKARTDGGMPE